VVIDLEVAVDIHTNEIIFTEDGASFVSVPYSFDIDSIISYSPYMLEDNKFINSWTVIVSNIGMEVVIEYDYNKLKEDRLKKDNLNMILTLSGN